MNIENNTTRPLFEKVKDDISARIKSGEYPAGSKIPTEVELIKQYDVSRITIRRAIEELCKDGLLVKNQGKGTFVKERKIFRKIEHNMSFSNSCIVNGMTPSAVVTQRTVLTKNSPGRVPHPRLDQDAILYIQRVRYADEIPVMLENNYFPFTQYAFLLTDDLEGPLYDLLKSHGIIVGCSQNSYIDALKADSKQAQLLKIAPGDPLFLLYTEIYDSQNQLIYIGQEYIVASRYRFNYENA